MRFLNIGPRLPVWATSRLFGDRDKFGLKPRGDDPDWIAWTRGEYVRFYNATQRRSVGKVINGAGYRVMKRVCLDGKAMLEIGPGSIPHIPFWRNKPKKFVIADVQEQMLNLSRKRLLDDGIHAEPVLLDRTEQPRLPFESGEFDIIVSFYSFEHMHPFESYLTEILRCLKGSGLLVGAIPAEGGLAWGLGRFLTSRRWLIRNTNINPDKIICWEHPTYAVDILRALDQRLQKVYLSFYPLAVPVIDLNLVIRFIYRKL